MNLGDHTEAFSRPPEPLQSDAGPQLSSRHAAHIFLALSFGTILEVLGICGVTDSDGEVEV